MACCVRWCSALLRFAEPAAEFWFVRMRVLPPMLRPPPSLQKRGRPQANGWSTTGGGGVGAWPEDFVGQRLPVPRGPEPL